MSYKNFKKTEIIDEIGIKLRSARISAELTLSQATEELLKSGFKISVTMLGRIENGDRRIDDDLFLALCKLYKEDPKIIITHACQAHVAAISKEAELAELMVLGESDQIVELVKEYLSLPNERKTDVRNTVRILSRMEKIKAEGTK